MTPEMLEKLWARRFAGVREIAEHVDQFKECEQCRSMSPKEYGLCPWCRGYRFIEDPAIILKTLQTMATRPWPFIAAVVPRSIGEVAPLKPVPVQTRQPTEGRQP